MINVFNDIFNHKKGEVWNEESLQLSFLIKYYDSSAYRRLWVLSNFRLPPPTTIDTHFEPKVKYVEYCSTNEKEIESILDTYWESNKTKIHSPKHDLIIEESYKIKICSIIMK